MSDVIENENGRIGEIDAPAGAREKDAGFDVGAHESAEDTTRIMPSFTDHRLLAAHQAAGHELIPLHDKDAVGFGGKRTGKHPLHKGWPTETPMTAEESVSHMLGGGNVGVRLRDTDLVIDVDPRNFDAGDDPVARLWRDLALPDCPFVRTGGGGFHFYMRKPSDVAIRHTHDGYPGIEFATAGRYVVAAGSIHPDTGRLYVLDDDVLALPLSEAPEAATALLEAIRKPIVEASSGEPGEIMPEQLARLLSVHSVLKYNRRYDAWLRIMMAAHHGTNGEGVEEFVAWSCGDPDYADDEASIRDRWNRLTIKPGGVTLGTLLKALADDGHGAFIEEVLRSPAAEDFPDTPEMPLSEADIALAEVNRGHFTVLHGGKYLVGRERRHPTLGNVEVEWFSDHAVRNHLDSRTVTLDDGSVRPLGSWWVKHPMRRQYDGVVFDPAPDRKHDMRYYNLWRGWAVAPKVGDWSLMQRMVRDVLCGGDEASFDYVVRWAAFMVQKPHVPAEVALVFKGAKGVGKGTFARALRDIAGSHGKQVAQPEHFIGRFNEHLMDCILLVVDEGFWAGDKKAEGALKNLITEPIMTFEPKGKPIVSGPNMLHPIILSNEDWIVPASADERRFAVFEASTEARRSLPADFFDALNAQMRNGGLSAMLHDLVALDLTGWHPRSHIPRTLALTDQKVQAFRRDPMSFWWYRLLEDGESDTAISEEKWRVGHMDVGSIEKDELLRDLTDVARTMGRHGPFTKTAMARFLRTVGVEVDAKDTRGNRVWRLPRLDQARHAFESHVGGRLDWDGE